MSLIFCRNTDFKWLRTHSLAFQHVLLFSVNWLLEIIPMANEKAVLFEWITTIFNSDIDLQQE